MDAAVLDAGGVGDPAPDARQVALVDRPSGAGGDDAGGDDQVVVLPPGRPVAEELALAPAAVTFDLTDRQQRGRVYEQLLRAGTAADVRYFVDVDELIDLFFPRAVTAAWTRWLARHRG